MDPMLAGDSVDCFTFIISYSLNTFMFAYPTLSVNATNHECTYWSVSSNAHYLAYWKICFILELHKSPIRFVYSMGRTLCFVH